MLLRKFVFVPTLSTSLDTVTLSNGLEHVPYRGGATVNYCCCHDARIDMVVQRRKGMKERKEIT